MIRFDSELLKRPNKIVFRHELELTGSIAAAKQVKIQGTL